MEDKINVSVSCPLITAKATDKLTEKMAGRRASVETENQRRPRNDE